ncbi:MAG: hypothetical protein JNM27_04190 [Leptospirales bacterium]|nr:hypothetical protein [Leptospirales bacterium]
MRNNMFRVLAAAFCLIAVARCATIFSGHEYNFNFDSTPQGATVKISRLPRIESTIREFQTPANTKLDMKDDYNISVELQGYKTQSWKLEKETNMITLLNIIVGGAIGFVVDYVTGSINKPVRTNLSVQLVKNTATGETFSRVTLQNHARTVIAQAPLIRGNGTQDLEFDQMRIQ